MVRADVGRALAGGRGINGVTGDDVTRKKNAWLMLEYFKQSLRVAYLPMIVLLPELLQLAETSPTLRIGRPSLCTS